jgi:hypothetical protein
MLDGGKKGNLEIVNMGLKHGIIEVDKDGKLWMKNGTIPIHANFTGSSRKIGLRICKRAAN